MSSATILAGAGARGQIQAYTVRRTPEITMSLKWAVIAFAVASACAYGQRSNGYVFVAPGQLHAAGFSQSTLQIGFGGEYVVRRVGAGIGGELSALGPTEAFSSAVGVASINGYYHFARSRARLDPFVTGGYSLFFRSGHLSLGNFGGGVNWWFQPRIGLRLEFRDHIRSSGRTAHWWGVRFGLVF
jgi:hypothetical protein